NESSRGLESNGVTPASDRQPTGVCPASCSDCEQGAPRPIRSAVESDRSGRRRDVAGRVRQSGSELGVFPQTAKSSYDGAGTLENHPVGTYRCSGTAHPHSSYCVPPHRSRSVGQTETPWAATRLSTMSRPKAIGGDDGNRTRTISLED